MSPRSAFGGKLSPSALTSSSQTCLRHLVARNTSTPDKELSTEDRNLRTGWRQGDLGTLSSRLTTLGRLSAPVRPSLVWEEAGLSRAWVLSPSWKSPLAQVHDGHPCLWSPVCVGTSHLPPPAISPGRCGGGKALNLFLRSRMTSCCQSQGSYLSFSFISGHVGSL